MAKTTRKIIPSPEKSETASHVAEQSSWAPLPCCSPPRCSFSINSLALSACVSPRTIHFGVLDKSPLLGPGGGSLLMQDYFERKAKSSRFRKRALPPQPPDLQWRGGWARKWAGRFAVEQPSCANLPCPHSYIEQLCTVALHSFNC